MPFGAGASEMPQVPATTVVTPWLTFGAMSGAESIRQSSCVCASMKPGAAILPRALISFFAFSSTRPMAAILPSRIAMSPANRGARVPSITVASRMTRSINFGPGLLHDVGPFRRLLAHELEEGLRPRAVGLGVELAIALRDRRRGERLADLGGQPGDDLLRQLRRPDHAAPGVRLVARHSLGDRRKIRELRRALRRGDAEAAHPAGFDVGPDRRNVVEHHLDIAGHEVVDCLRAALVGHVDDVGPGHELEELSAQVPGGAVARRAVGELARVLLRVGDELLHR